MYLNLEGREVPVNFIGESKGRLHNGMLLEHVTVSVAAKNEEEQRQILNVIDKLKRNGIQSTDGIGNTHNTWKVINTSWTKVAESNPAFYIVLDLEEHKNW